MILRETGRPDENRTDILKQKLSSALLFIQYFGSGQKMGVPPVCQSRGRMHHGICTKAVDVGSFLSDI